MRRAGPEQIPRFFGRAPGLGGGAVRGWPLVSGTLPLRVQNGKLWVCEALGGGSPSVSLGLAGFEAASRSNCCRRSLG